MNIAIYHPFINNGGGGETVALTLATMLAEKHEVTMLVAEKPDKKFLTNFFNLDINKLKFKIFGAWVKRFPSFSSFKQSILVRAAHPLFDTYDMVIDTFSNGLFHKKTTAKTMCYVHFPNYTAKKYGLRSLLNFLLVKEKEMYAYDKVIANSNFTADYLKKKFGVSATVIYPPVKIDSIHPQKKEDTITTIGRFSPEKKLELLIESFIAIEDKLPTYTLQVIGGYQHSNKQYFDFLKEKAKGHRITFYQNLTHDKTLALLEKSKMYWHARGFGETDPVEFENFGIVTVEAMAAGCECVVINKGAQPEIVKGITDCHVWNTLKQLKSITLKSLGTRKKRAASKILLRSLLQKYGHASFKREINKQIMALSKAKTRRSN